MNNLKNNVKSSNPVSSNKELIFLERTYSLADFPASIASMIPGNLRKLGNTYGLLFRTTGPFILRTETGEETITDIEGSTLRPEIFDNQSICEVSVRAPKYGARPMLIVRLFIEVDKDADRDYSMELLLIKNILTETLGYRPNY